MAVPIVVDSITHLKPEHRGAAVLCASHGGRYAAWYAAEMGAAAAIFNDAGIGREQAGISGLDLLARLDVPAACVSHRSACIGHGGHTLANGILSCVNRQAEACGLAVGMTARAAIDRLAAVALPVPAKPPAEEEARFDATDLGRDGIRVMVMDFDLAAGARRYRPHRGQRLARRIARRQAGDGHQAAGVRRRVQRRRSRLSTMPASRGCRCSTQRGIAGACVSAFSARIGDGASTLDDGYISALNETARRFGGDIGQNCRQFVAAMVAARAGAG